MDPAQSSQPDVSNALRQARRAIDGALSRDRGRLHGLWSRWSGKPADERAREAFAQALSASVAQRQARAAALPQAPVDPGLPIAAEAERIVELIRKHQVIVIAGETGSGKTTQLPKLCLAAGRGAAGMIGCTQPRRIAARAVARRVAEELQTQLGGAVGYQVRFTENVGEQTAVKFMTDGILLAEIQSDRWLSRYDTILIDEAHERSLNIDFLLGYLKQLLQRRPDLKVIVTSATIDTERFAQHFGDAPVVNVEGRGYPVSVRYRPLGEGEDRRRRTRSQRQRRHRRRLRRDHARGSARRRADLPARRARDPRRPPGAGTTQVPRDRSAAAVRAAVGARPGSRVQSRAQAPHRARHQRRGNLADGAAHPLRGRSRPGPRQALQSARQARPPAHRTGQPGQRRPAQGSLRAHQRRHLLPPVLRSRFPVAGALHRP